MSRIDELFGSKGNLKNGEIVTQPGILGVNERMRRSDEGQLVERNEPGWNV